MQTRIRATYLPIISLALRSDGVLYLTRQMKEIDLGLTASEMSREREPARKKVNI
jgi:hypothetical protein